MKVASFEELLRDFKSGVTNMTKNGKCSSCGNCCTSILPVSKEELKRITAYVKKRRIKKTEANKEVTLDMTCPFRDNEKRICRIYEVRPKICEVFVCSKWKNVIEQERDAFEFDLRYRTVNLREYF